MFKVSGSMCDACPGTLRSAQAGAINCPRRDCRGQRFRGRHFRGRRFRGFTLVELLVVIAIIALLLGILIVGVNKGTAAAEKAAANQYMGTISLAIKTYHNDFQAYPPSVVSSSAEYCGVTGVTGWKGDELLTQAMVGMEDSVHSGLGWAMSTNPKVYGPYVNTGEHGIIKKSDGHYALCDTWDQPIQYYRAHFDETSNPWDHRFVCSENDSAPKVQPADDSTLVSAKYLLLSIGADGKASSGTSDAEKAKDNDNIVVTGP